MKKIKFERTKLTFRPTTIRLLQTVDLQDVGGGRINTIGCVSKVCDRTGSSDNCGGTNTGHVATCQ